MFSWDGPNSGTPEYSGIANLHGHHWSFVGAGRADFARASEVDPQCVLILIFEADLRNPSTHKTKNETNLNLNLEALLSTPATTKNTFCTHLVHSKTKASQDGESIYVIK